MAQDAPAYVPPSFTPRPFANVHYSLSKQFVIRDLPKSPREAIPLEILTNSVAVHLDSTLLAVSCERVKKALLHELDATDQWKGRIFISLHHARSLDEPIVVGSQLFGHEWVYYMNFPDAARRGRVLTALTDVLLLEMANRESDRSAEIPAWLGEGMALQLERTSSVDLIVQSSLPFSPSENSMTVEVHEGRRVDPLLRSHQELQYRPPMTLEELSWPNTEELDGPDAAAFRASAQFFVDELLYMPDGRACMLAMVKELARYYNWQFAFLRAFQSHFGTQLDVEKWWALQLIAFTGRNLNQTWPPAESWKKVDAAVRPIVQIRTGINELPMRAPVTLQTIVGDWDFSRQTPFLRERIAQLRLLRSRVSQDLAGLVDDYRTTLETYLARRDEAGITPMGRAMANPRVSSIARRTMKELDALDAKKEQLHRKLERPPVVAANAG